MEAFFSFVEESVIAWFDVGIEQYEGRSLSVDRQNT